ncbi:hypothetical protein FACS1894189_3820 [Planctomycetales bacterium]|nr:hypothetical protein FACS1894189_3820 [Planctomycetales bacterium]
MTTTDTLIDNTPEQNVSLSEVQPPAAEDVGELVDLLHLIDGLPMEYRADFYRAMTRLVSGAERRQRILGYVQESLSQMNLDLKYLIFDLEATRRERDEYKKQLFG